MTFRHSGQLSVGQTNRPNLLPSLKKTCYDQKLLKPRVPYQMSLDDKLYRLTTNHMIKGMIRQNDSEIKKLRTTFLNKKADQKIHKRIGQYQIIREIGKGGFAQVYQVQDSNHKKYALKEYYLQNALDCFNNESVVGDHFFTKGQIRKELQQLQGHPNLIKFVQKFRIGKYGYIVQELSEQSLSKNISDIQGIFHNNQRIYQVRFKDFYRQLAEQNYLKKIMIQLCNVVKLINSQGFIHCDLKLQNLMLSFNNNEPTLKLIDFGSTFEMQFGLPKVTITPEYMPPELLIMLQNGKEQSQLLKKIDIWSIGCILLQIITGVPLWFRYKCRVQIKGRPTVQLGIFALTGRDYSKIIKKQKQLVDSIKKIPFTIRDFDRFRPILKKLLVLNPDKRISLEQCIQMLQELQ